MFTLEKNNEKIVFMQREEFIRENISKGFSIISEILNPKEINMKMSYNYETISYMKNRICNLYFNNPYDLKILFFDPSGENTNMVSLCSVEDLYQYHVELKSIVDYYI